MAETPERKRPLFEKSGAKTFLNWACAAETSAV
jgi:hypothetical protein